ncbi:WhiB family transcriptional regulator [Streptomyces sp. NPDC048415]|uniref:WhiB family transcriptional regulator n=1 Tax=Streptomyces sp. NPDC048415 TaxID=3154822 RepID=UPI00343B86C3
MTSYSGQVPDTHRRSLDWQEQAACHHDGELFFDPRFEYMARAICSRCPVRVECLAAVLEAERGESRDRRHGIVAGLGPGERWRIDPEANRNDLIASEGTPPACGTYQALMRHFSLGEPVDPVCRSGDTRRHAASTDSRSRRKAPPKAAKAVRPAPQKPALKDPAPVTPKPAPAKAKAPKPCVRGRTPKERHVYRLWSQGLSDVDIARRADLSTPAVRRIRDVLGLLPNRLKAAS